MVNLCHDLYERRAAIALGSNLGDSYGILEAAIQAIAQSPGIVLNAQSRYYETVAVGPPQPDYLNACGLLTTTLPPLALLNRLLTIEHQFGRVRRERWGPRLLDIDLLLVEEEVIDHPQLQVPHPRLRERAFVLVPLCEIAPTWIDPVSGEAIADLLRQVDCSGVKPISDRLPQMVLCPDGGQTSKPAPAP